MGVTRCGVMQLAWAYVLENQLRNIHSLPEDGFKHKMYLS